jgi:hypothetical protein
MNLCIKHGISKLPVALKLDNSNLVFPSDNSFIAYDIFNDFKVDLRGTILSFKITADLPKHFTEIFDQVSPIVEKCDTPKPILKFYRPNPQIIQPIICELPNPTNVIDNATATDIIHSWISVACNNEFLSLAEQVTNTFEDVMAVSNFSFDYQPRFDRFDLQLQNIHSDNSEVFHSTTENPNTKTNEPNFTRFEPPINTSQFYDLSFATVRNSDLEPETLSLTIGDILEVASLANMTRYREDLRRLATFKNVGSPFFTSIALELTYQHLNQF